ncbi:hypothetical protein C7M84_010208 [Penaeus vannamei]|uniref:Uncharacterized protein n=1 Tax=Penaeus vannamei TaxID=6689 RepID=A0A423T4P3_PENVA|nr:hypothetical protein C7M84_010208 [Penaeus vannamei]
MPRSKASQPGSRPPTPEDAGLEAEPPMALGGVLPDARAIAASVLELPQAQLAQLEARLIDRLAAAATLPNLSTVQTCNEEAAKQPPCPPPVTVSTQHTAPVASYLAPVMGDQSDTDAGERRHTLGHHWVAAASSRETATSSAAGLQPPPPMLSGSVSGPADHLQPSMLPQSTQYVPRLQHPLSPAHLHMASPAAASCIPPYSQSVPAQPCGHACPRFTLGRGRDEVPIFCGETPASQGIQRSQELESWISSIELSTQPATSKAYICMARSRISRYAWSVLNSPVFANIQDWVSFKARLRDQFRGVATAQHLYDMHGQARMAVGQGPLDFVHAVELAVEQGVCDYPKDIGNTEGLMQRTFREGLPGWLRGQLLWHDFSTRKMAEKCQAVWDCGWGETHPA